MYAMADLPMVRRGEAPGDLARDSQCLVERQRPLLELLLEALPFVEGQGEERSTALGLAGLVDRRHVRVVELGHGLSLA